MSAKTAATAKALFKDQLSKNITEAKLILTKYEAIEDANKSRVFWNNATGA